ncbi:MAG: chromosome segregation protein SMC [Peptococcaceae bacterium]|nr:chromosome segregation protein SMC [Peptococcaceae bacterium]
MKIRRVEVYGFKSFADRTEIELGEGLTAIVGPNGSGKSNIADAVKWVLGEQSPRVLRGSRMEDIIFGGTAKRKSIGFAEVTVVFDNSSKRLPLDAIEVMITRRVFRNQESEYLINRRPCRLKDITELFLDTGIGRDSYSFVGQGRIEEIISADPRNRRVIFEEAAGISRYKLRKRETEVRLTETAANLCRVRDVSAELGNQLDPLGEEAQKAREYLELSARRENWEQALLSYELGLNERLTQSLTQQTERINDEHLSLDISRSTLLTKQTTTLLLDSEIHIKIQDRERSIYENKLLLRQKSERQLEIAAALEKAHGQRAILAKRLTQYQDEQQKIAQQISRLRLDETEERRNLAQNSAELEIIEAWGDTPAAKRELDLKREIAVIEERLFQENRERIANEKQIVRLEEQLTQKTKLHLPLFANHTEYAAGLAELDVKIAAEKINLAALEGEERRLTVRISELRQEQKQQSDNLNKQQAQLFRTENRYRALKSSEEQMEGLSRGVKYVLRSGLPGILGVIGELISTPAGLETAIEVALGGAVSDIVTVTEGQAKSAVKLLKDKEQGRATFFPLDAMRPRTARDVPAIVKAMPNFLGRAVDLVSSQPQVRPVVLQLLGNVLVVDSIDAVTLVAKETGNAWRIVTLDGDIRQPSGSLTGGSRPERQAWLLVRKREIEDAEKEISRLREEVKELDKSYTATQTSVTSALATEERQRLAIEQSKRSLLAYDLQWTKHRSLLEQNDMESKALSESIAALEKEQAVLRQVVELAQSASSQDELALTALCTEALSLAETNAERRVELQVAKARYETMLGTYAMRLTEQEALYNEAGSRAAEVLRELLHNQDEQDTLVASLAQVEQDVLFLEQRVAVMAEAHGVEQGERLALQKEQQEIVAALDKNLQDSNLNRQKLHNLAIRLERLKVEAEYLQAKLGEISEDTRRNVININNRSEAESAIATLDAQILELGAIRVSAIDEHARISERVAFLTKEQEDLESASGRLKEVLANLDAIMGERFLAGFNEVKTAFQEMVGRLFGGATSRLFLIDKDKPLESGIEIDVQPVGKRLQNIALLSGGERALVAIALVCAVLKVKPTPFCVLDEIDAPLDDANVERLIAVLRDLSSLTQFLLITHTKGTMMASDVLYGVTMPEQGVSKILTVRISDIATG